jgi:CRP/FNR family transcriptional regulator, cyclic AMP receptor protein
LTPTKRHWSKQHAEEFLSRSYWYGALPHPMKRSILDHGAIRQFKPNTAVYRIGDTVDGMYAALEGDLRVYVYGDDGERILQRLLGPGSWIGEFHLVDGYPTRTFELWAASSCSTLFLPKCGFEAIANETQENYRQFVRLMCVHTRFLVRIAVEARSDAPRKTARALIRIAKMHGRNIEAGVQLPVNLSQSDLASLVGVSRQYMNELISRWNEQGLLIWKGNASPVLFIEELKKLLTPLDDWMAESEGWA